MPSVASSKPFAGNFCEIKELFLIDYIGHIFHINNPFLKKMQVYIIFLFWTQFCHSYPLE